MRNWFAPLCAAAIGCGTHANDEIPDDLLDAIRERTAGGDYPEGATGTAVGDISPNLCFRGWPDPQAADFDIDALEPICFGDFYQPDAAGERLLLVNTAALWCSACQLEYGGANSRPSLSVEVEARTEAGLAVLGTLFQDTARRPAAPSHGAQWARAFDVDFPFGIDPDFAMGAFADADVQPFNLLIDARTMRVVLRVDGDNPDVLWPAIDERLGAE
jgi:hypothetical protein